MEERFFRILMDRFDRIERRQDQSDESRRALHEKVNHAERSIDRLTDQLSNFSKSIDNLSPTVEDYIRKSYQVEGAGRLGKALWWLGGLILTAAASVVSYFAGKS